MPPLPRLVVSDLDGTLLDPTGVVSERTRSALRDVHDRGSIVVAATGRSHLSAREKVEPVGVIGWIVCSNGASLYDVAAGRLVETRPLSPQLVAEVVEAALAHDTDMGFAWEHPDGIDHAAGFGYDDAFAAAVPHAELVQRSKRPPSPVTELPGPSLKLLVATPSRSGAETAEVLAPRLPSGVTVISSGAKFAEITAAGVDKASGLARLCDRLGLDPTDSVAFGDQPNDLAMLGWAGTGVAMAHADPRVVAVADEITASNDADGVAQWLERRLG